MRQLIGSDAEWAANDLVIGDGEIAIERDAAGFTMKVGDGVKKYSELPSNGFDDAADPAKGDAMVAVKQTLPGGTARTQHDKNAESISVFDFMTPAQIADTKLDTPTIDATPFINAATSATLAFTSNENAPKRDVRVPAGNWRVDGPVYIRKGQTLRGDGVGATRVLQSNSLGNKLFVLGAGRIGGVETPDPGGLAPCIKELHIAESSSSAPAISTSASGAMICDLFLTNCGLGIGVSGGDVLISRVIIDQGLVGIAISGQNIIVSDCLIFLANYGIILGSNLYDAQINNCHFEYQQIASILFNDAAVNIRNVSVSACQFVLNEQHAGFNGFVQISTGDAQAQFAACSFRNMKGYAVNHITGIGGSFTFSDCIFDGSKTVSGYAQSTTAGAVKTDNETMRLIGCQFRNLHQTAIAWGGTFDARLQVQGGSYSNVGGTYFIDAQNSNAGSSLLVQGVAGDGVRPLVNLTHVPAVALKGNKNWLGAAQTASSRFFWQIPTRGAGLVRVGVKANTASGSNPNYSKASNILAARHVGFDGSTVVDYAAKQTIYETPATDIVPVVDVAVALDAVGGPASAAYANPGRYLVVSVPNTYTNVGIEADFEIA